MFTISYITVNNLSLGYEGKEILNDINFTVEKGNYLCIVGENGSGKSTIMKTLLGLISPMKGEILFDEGLKKNEIGYLPQQTIIQRDFPASVGEVVLSGCQGRRGIRPFFNKEEKNIALENMKEIQIIGLKNKCYCELSGGQQQRVLLARALCATRKALLLDEPVTGLDPKATDEMYDLIYKLNKEGITIIMISHDISAALKYATHILHMNKRLFFGTKKEYLESNIGKRFLSIEEGEIE